MHIACLHTSASDAPLYDKLIKERAPRADVSHRVVPHLLEAPLDHIAPEVASLMTKLSSADAVLCTCTTLGPLIGLQPHHIRINRPVLDVAVAQAISASAQILLIAYKPAPLSGMQQLMQSQFPDQCVSTLFLPEIAQDVAAARWWQVAERIKAVLDPFDPAVIILAQASLYPLGMMLRDLACVVLTTPETACDAAVRIATA